MYIIYYIIIYIYIYYYILYIIILYYYYILYSTLLLLSLLSSSQSFSSPLPNHSSTILLSSFLPILFLLPSLLFSSFSTFLSSSPHPSIPFPSIFLPFLQFPIFILYVSVLTYAHLYLRLISQSTIRPRTNYRKGMSSGVGLKCIGLVCVYVSCWC